MWGSATTWMPASATSSATLRWTCFGLDAERTAVAGRDAVRELGLDDPLGEVVEEELARVERLVGVQVDRQAGLGGDVEEALGRLDRVVLEMRTAADEVDSRPRPPRAAARAVSAPAGPVDGQPHSTLTWMSMRPRNRSRTSISASTIVSPLVVGQCRRGCGSRCTRWRASAGRPARRARRCRRR